MKTTHYNVEGFHLTWKCYKLLGRMSDSPRDDPSRFGVDEKFPLETGNRMEVCGK